jgi:hypothetical protein
MVLLGKKVPLEAVQLEGNEVGKAHPTRFVTAA